MYSNYTDGFTNNLAPVTTSTANWNDLESRNNAVSEWLLNGVVTAEVRGSVPFSQEFDLQRGDGIKTAIRHDNKTDIRLYQDPQVVELELPIFNNDIRAGMNTRDNRKPYSPRSQVVLPEFKEL